MAQKITNLKKPVLFVFIGFVTLLTFQNCAEFVDSSHDSEYIASRAPYSFIEAEAKAILSQRCASCHSPVSEDAGAVAAIPNINDAFEMQNSGIIIIGSPQDSPLYISIIDRTQPPVSPDVVQEAECDFDPDCVPDDERAIIRDWLLGPDKYANDYINNSGGGDTTPLRPTFANLRSNIINNYCIGCHSGAGGRSDFRTYAGVVATVTAGAPNTSRLYQRVTATDPAVRMPRNAPPLSAAQVTLIRDWISAGALNN